MHNSTSPKLLVGSLGIVLDFYSDVEERRAGSNVTWDVLAFGPQAWNISATVALRPRSRCFLLLNWRKRQTLPHVSLGGISNFRNLLSLMISAFTALNSVSKVSCLMARLRKSHILDGQLIM